MENEKYLILTERRKSEIRSFLPEERDVLKLADYFQNFSDSTRLKILSCLSFCDLCVSDLSALLNINQTTISHQLKTLKDQNMVSFRRNGKIIIYYLKSRHIDDMLAYAVNSMNWGNRTRLKIINSDINNYKNKNLLNIKKIDHIGRFLIFIGILKSFIVCFCSVYH